MRPLEWRPLADPVAQARLERVLRSWAATPYVAGQRRKRRGVDCVNFVLAVLDELTGRVTPTERITPDTCVHAPHVAQHALERLVDRYDCERVLDDVLEPGDVIATGPEGCGPGHAVIVGCERRVCWDASGLKVRKISLGLAALVGHDVFGIYRLRDRRWS